jgi:CRISPR/Cas system-associated exonuclease Cas4 (RecB family)
LPDPLRISAKNLGDLAVPGYCPRCFWVKLHAERLPYQIFPGIFSSIDSYTKKVIHHLMDAHGQVPAWLGELGGVDGYIDSADLHHSRFRYFHPESGVLLTGTPDDVFTTAGGGHVVVDYKTARYTPAQGAMLPVYRTQLNGYAYIGEQSGWRVERLALVYFEPVSDDEAAREAVNHRADGFALGFSARLVPVDLDTAAIPDLLATARRIHDLPAPPEAIRGCKECAALEGLLALLS